MATLLVSYDLSKPETSSDYARVVEYMRTYVTRCKPLYSLWMIKTTKTRTEVRDELLQITDSNDKLLVVDVTGDAAAWSGLSQETSDWIKAHL